MIQFREIVNILDVLPIGTLKVRARVIPLSWPSIINTMS